MMGFYERYKRRQEETEAQYMDWRYDDGLAEEIRLESALTLAEEVMLNSPCAINGMQNCSKECTHFGSGSIMHNTFYGDTIRTVEKPRCKLWKL